MKMIATFAVATALLGLTACSNENTAPGAEVVAPAPEVVAPAAEAVAPAAEAAPEATGGPCGDGRELAENEVCP